MKKEYTIREIIGFYRAMNELMGSEVKLPGKVLWNMRLNRKELENIAQTYDEYVMDIQKEYLSAGKTFDTTDEKGNSITSIKPEYQGEIIERIREIETQTVDVTIRTVSYDLVSDIEFTGKQWMGIEFMLEEPEN